MKPPALTEIGEIPLFNHEETILLEQPDPSGIWSSTNARRSRDEQIRAGKVAYTGKQIRLLPTVKTLFAVLVGLLLTSAAQACEIPSGKAQAEAELIRFTNAQRSGRPEVAVSAKLSAAAQKHACYMARKRQMTHDGAGRSNVGDRATREGYVWRSVAENVAKGYRSPVSVGKGWMGSRGHRRNMLLPRLSEIGIGWARANGVDYWVMVLAAPR